MRSLLCLAICVSLAVPVLAQPGDPYADDPPTGPRDPAADGQAPDTGNRIQGNATRGPGSATHAAQRAADAQATADASAWRNLSSSQRAAGLARAEQAGLFAGFQVANGSASGRFVSFQFDLDGTVQAFTVHQANTTFFDKVQASPFAANGTELHGAVFRERSDNASLSVHNNPTALLAYRGSNLSVSLDLGAGVSVQPNMSGNRTLQLVSAGGQGSLLLLGNATWSLTDSDTVGVQVSDGGVMFLARPAKRGGLDEADIVRGIAEGRVGAVANVASAAGAALMDADSMGVNVRATRAANRSLELTVESDDPAGKAVVVRVDNGTLPAGAPEQVVVRLDGVALTRAATAREAIEASARGQGAAFVTIGEGTIEAVVSIPHFSLLTLQFAAITPASPGAGTNDTSGGETPPPGPPPSPAPSGGASTPGPGVLAVAAVVVAVALAAARRRR